MADGYPPYGADWFNKHVDTGEDHANKDVKAPLVWVGNVVAMAFSMGSVIFGGVEVTIQQAAISVTTTGPNPIVAAVPSKSIYVIGFSFWATLNTDLRWLSAATTIVDSTALSPRQQYGGNFLPGWFTKTNAGEALNWTQTGSGATDPATIRGSLFYVAV